MSAASPQRRIPRELWIVAGVGFAAALSLVLAGFRMYDAIAKPGDPYGYGEIARGFMEHGFDKVTRRAAMLYPHLLWGLYAIGANDLVALLVNVLLHTGTCALVFLIGQRMYNSRAGLIAGLIVSVHPMLVRYVPELHTEALLTFLCTLTVWCALRFHDRPSIGNGILLGLVGTMGVLCKGVMLPVVVTYGAVWFVRGVLRKNMQAIAGVIAIALTMIAVIAPWTYRNYQVSGRFVLLTPGSPDAFLRGYIFTRLEFATLQKPPYTDAENESNALFKRLAAEAGTTWEADEIQDDVNNGREVKRRLREEPLDTVRKVAVGLFTFWYEMTSLRNSLVPALLAILGWTLAVIGLRRDPRTDRPTWLLWLPIVVMNVVVAALIPLGRYSVPIIPCLALLASFGVDTLLRARAERAASGAAQPGSAAQGV